MILIVDDKPENIFSLKTLLQLHHYEVDSARSGEEALKKILKTEYSLVILDVQMPDMDGYEVAEVISGYSKSKDVPILFLSAVHIDKRYIIKGYDSGGVDYLTKPIDPDLLLLKVKTFQRLSDQNRELNAIRVSLEKKVDERTKNLLDTNHELEVMNAELQQYASLATHDLQEPLRKITIFSNIIKDKYLKENDEAQAYLGKIISASERMRDIINDLLHYSKLSAEPQFEMTDLDKILQETFSDLEVAIAEKNAQFKVQRLPVAEVIPGQIRQAFFNILSNALKFVEKDRQPVIEISCDSINENSITAPAVEAGDYLRIFFKDNGIGFNEKYLDKIFTMFQRLHDRDRYGGTGIGLAMVKKIVENHNGSVSARSQENKGSTFIIIIPKKTKNNIQA